MQHNLKRRERTWLNYLQVKLHHERVEDIKRILKVNKKLRINLTKVNLPPRMIIGPLPAFVLSFFKWAFLDKA